MTAGLSRKADEFATDAGAFRMAAARSDMPPFWELEALIGHGHSMTDALAIMARRHAEQAFPVIWLEAAQPAPMFAGRARLSA